MKNRNTEGDSWGQLLSDFGIEDDSPHNDTVQTEAVHEGVAPLVESTAVQEPIDADGFAAGILDSRGEDANEEATPKEKKSFFSRFPKINFFGAPPVVSLDSVIEAVKSPSLGGKAFTDNTLEKIPASQERKGRHKKDKQEKVVESKADAWSTVASQIDTLASGKDAKGYQAEKRPGKRDVVSMFDDPIPESEELRTLKTMMDETPCEEEPNSRQRGRGRGQQRRETQYEARPSKRAPFASEEMPEEREVREVRGRGARYRPPVEVDDLPESDFVMMDDEPADEPVTPHGRGRRGSRHSGDDYRGREPMPAKSMPFQEREHEEWSEVDVALQSGRGASAPRGGRNQRFDKRRDAARAEPADIEDNVVVAYHTDVPSWDEAIGDIISGNLARHRSHAGSGGRGRR